MLWFLSPGSSPNPQRSTGANHCLPLSATGNTQKSGRLKKKSQVWFLWICIISYSWHQQITSWLDLNMVWTCTPIRMATKHYKAENLLFICDYRVKIKSVNLEKLTFQNLRTIYTSKFHINASSKVVSQHFNSNFCLLPFCAVVFCLFLKTRGTGHITENACILLNAYTNLLFTSSK